MELVPEMIANGASFAMSGFGQVESGLSNEKLPSQEEHSGDGGGRVFFHLFMFKMWSSSSCMLPGHGNDESPISGGLRVSTGLQNF